MLIAQVWGGRSWRKCEALSSIVFASADRQTQTSEYPAKPGCSCCSTALADSVSLDCQVSRQNVDVSAISLLAVQFFDSSSQIPSARRNSRLVAPLPPVWLQRPFTSPLRTHTKEAVPHLLLPTGTLRACSSRDRIPLGSALVIFELAELPGSFDLVDLAEAHPWFPIAVVTGGVHDEETALRTWRRQDGFRRMVELKGPKESLATELRDSLASDGKPEPDEVARYITQRCGDPKFAEALRASLLRHNEPPRSTRHGIFRRWGPFTLRDWVALYYLTQALSLPHHLSAYDAGTRLGIDGRTLKGYCERFDYRDWWGLRNRFGWRWVVQEVLERNGYFGAHAQAG